MDTYVYVYLPLHIRVLYRHMDANARGQRVRPSKLEVCASDNSFNAETVVFSFRVVGLDCFTCT